MQNHQICTESRKSYGSNVSGQTFSKSKGSAFVYYRALSRKRMLLMRISILQFPSINPRRYMFLPSLSQDFVTKKQVLHCIWTVRFLTSLVSYLCFSGIQNMNLTVVEGEPLPFAFDILTTVFHYGNRAFVKYPYVKRHTRLFQAVVSWGVFLGTKHDLWRRRHLHRHQWHKVSKMT